MFHFQKSKSVTAAEASIEMNPELKIDAQQHKGDCLLSVSPVE